MLLENYISPNPEARVLVLFGGNPIRRHEVIRHLKEIPNLSVIGTLSETEGMETLKNLPRVDIVLIGGRYDVIQRQRIKTYVAHHMPKTKVTEPGLDYPYDDQVIIQQVQKLLT